MAPLIRLVALFSIFASVIASPHLPRNAYNHAHRAIAHLPVRADDSSPPPVPRRQRSLNKRCVPRPSNSSSIPLPSSTPPNPSPTPLNVAPSPSLPPPDSSSSSSPPPYSPPPYSAPSPSPSPNTPAPAPSPSTSSTPSTPTPTPTPSSGNSYSGSSEPSFMTGTQTGQGTWYDTGLGACGITNTNSDFIAAVSHLLYDQYPGYSDVNPNSNPVCGRQIKVTDPTTKQQVTVTVTDRCEACQQTDLDLSPVAFGVLASLGVGRVGITWEWA